MPRASRRRRAGAADRHRDRARSARRKDGSEFPIEIMLSPLESDDGILVTAAIRDISVRKDAEAADGGPVPRAAGSGAGGDGDQRQRRSCS